MLKKEKNVFFIHKIFAFAIQFFICLVINQLFQINQFLNFRIEFKDKNSYLTFNKMIARTDNWQSYNFGFTIPHIINTKQIILNLEFTQIIWIEVMNELQGPLIRAGEWHAAEVRMMEHVYRCMLVAWCRCHCWCAGGTSVHSRCTAHRHSPRHRNTAHCPNEYHCPAMSAVSHTCLTYTVS